MAASSAAMYIATVNSDHESGSASNKECSDEEEEDYLRPVMMI